MNTKDKKRAVRVKETQYSTWQIIGRKIQRVIWFVSSIVQGLIFLRILLLLVDANPNNVFANFIFESSSYFLTPFNNLVSNITIGGVTFDLTAFIAILIYWLATWLINEFIWILFSTTTKKQQVIYEE